MERSATPNAMIRESAPAQRVIPDVMEIHTQHVAFVWRVLRRLGVEHAAIEDAVHQVFVVVHRRHAQLSEAEHVRSWLFAICRLVSLEFARRSRRTNDPLSEDLQCRAPDPESMTIHAERAETARRLLERVPEAMRLVFVLAEIEDMSMPEIAAALEINVNTAYSRLRRAREFITKLAATQAKKMGVP